MWVPALQTIVVTSINVYKIWPKKYLTIQGYINLKRFVGINNNHLIISKVNWLQKICLLVLLFTQTAHLILIKIRLSKFSLIILIFMIRKELRLSKKRETKSILWKKWNFRNLCKLARSHFRLTRLWDWCRAHLDIIKLLLLG